jgi:catechol 2,3-dioxygenase-like lactoylglutathione lyase family enzyme
MIVERLDHVNIITSDLAASAQFYGDLLDLEARDGPPPMRADQVQWMHDQNGQAVLHLNSAAFPRLYDRSVAKDEATGALHHVALRCRDVGKVKQRLEERGADYSVNEVPSIGLVQLFTYDPDNVLLELNFFNG